MSAIRARTLDARLDDLLDPEPKIAVVDLRDMYWISCNQAPRLVLAWHHIRMGLRVLTSGKALP